MAIAQTITVVDGKTYQPGEEIWDLGSFACVDVRGNIRSYEGLSSDISKLPHYVGTGSSALCLDTGDYYKFHKETDQWCKLMRYNYESRRSICNFAKEN